MQSQITAIRLISRGVLREGESKEMESERGNKRELKRWRETEVMFACWWSCVLSTVVCADDVSTPKVCLIITQSSVWGGGYKLQPISCTVYSKVTDLKSWSHTKELCSGYP